MIFLQLILITTIWCLGITVASQEGMIIHGIRKWADAKESKWAMPAITCIWCMPSIHSLAGYGFSIGVGVISSFSWSLVFMYPLVVCGASFCSGFIWAIYEMIAIKTKHISNIESMSYFDLKERKQSYKKNVTNFSR